MHASLKIIDIAHMSSVTMQAVENVKAMSPSKTVSDYGFGLILVAKTISSERQLCDKLSCAMSYDCACILLSILQIRRHRHSQT